MKLATSSSEEPYEDLPTDKAWHNSRCRATGSDFTEVALEYLERAGASVEQRGGKVADIQIAAIVRSPSGRRFIVLAHGTLDASRSAGFRRSDTVKKAGFDAVVLRHRGALPVLVITSHLPTAGVCVKHLAQLRPDVVDVVATEGDFAGFQRLRALFGAGTASPMSAPPASPAWQFPPGQTGLFDNEEGPHA